MLSVIVIVKNEARQIGRCLTSVSWADEIVVLDSGSQDDTVAICRQYTDRIYITDWPGFGPQKQRALAYASHDWVLSIDADETVSEALREEILKAIRNESTNGFEIPRLSSYCGRKIKHGGWWPDYVLRLFKRECGEFSNDLVHERVLVTGPVKRLNTPLLHESFTDLNEVLDKINSYSSLNAQKLFAAGKRTSLAEAICRGIWNFIKSYLLKTAFLDGRHGFMLAISNAEGTYYKYLKLLELQEQFTNEPDLISAIVSTYNNPKALIACLDSLLAQTDRNFEIIIADDGSDPTTSQAIAKYLENDRKLAIRHVYQEDRGFRAGRIRNLAVAQSIGNYLLFVDGDCVTLPDFVKTHRELASPQHFVPGNRILISRTFTEEVLQFGIVLHRQNATDFLRLRIANKINRFLPFLHLPLGRLRNLQPKKWSKAMSCNLGIWRDDFLAVNGFDEDFEGWGYEDSDLIIRLIHHGIKRKEGRFAAPVLHLWHPQNDRSRHDLNYQRLQQRLSDPSFIRSTRGIDQYI